MRILFFIESLRAGGKERRLTELIKGLKDVPEIEFEIVIMSEDIHYEEILNLNIKFHYLIRKSRKDLSVFNKFYRVSKTYKPDIIHCWDDMTAVIALPACKILGIKLVNGMVIDTPVQQNIFNKYWLRGKITFPFSDVIIGNSKAGLCAYGAPVKKSSVIYNGYNFRRNQEISDKLLLRKKLEISSEFIVAMIATFSEKKDYKTYFEAACIVLSKRDDVTFLAIGDKTDSTNSKKLITDKKLHQHFRFLGKISDIESYINLIDIGVLATFTEGISNSIMEFMAMGKTVVATNGGGTSEILMDGQTGYLVRPSDPLELANKIEILLNDEHGRNEMGKRAQKRIHDYFNIDTMVNKFILVYSEVLKKIERNK